MRGDGGPVTCRLRRSDVFTLSEIFAEGVYLRALPLPTRPFVVDAGATCVIQPGGSMRDEEVIAAANERGIAMVFTGVRHFRH